MTDILIAVFLDLKESIRANRKPFLFAFFVERDGFVKLFPSRQSVS